VIERNEILQIFHLKATTLNKLGLPMVWRILQAQGILHFSQTVWLNRTVFYGEYKNTGPGADMAGRVAYTRALSSEEAAKFTQFKWTNGSDWLHKTSLP